MIHDYEDLISQRDFHMKAHSKYEAKSMILSVILTISLIALLFCFWVIAQYKVNNRELIQKVLELSKKQSPEEQLPANELWHDKRDTLRATKQVDTSLIIHSEIDDAVQDGFRTH